MGFDRIDTPSMVAVKSKHSYIGTGSHAMIHSVPDIRGARFATLLEKAMAEKPLHLTMMCRLIRISQNVFVFFVPCASGRGYKSMKLHSHRE